MKRTLFSFLTLTLIGLMINFGHSAEVTSAAAPTGTTFTVNSNGDEIDIIPGDGICLSTAGTCTLRAAIYEANTNTDHDTIYFNFTSPTTIEPTSYLPRIMHPVTIDGVANNPSTCPTTTQPANLLVTLSGDPLGSIYASGLDFSGKADGSVIRGLNLVNWTGHAITLSWSDKGIGGLTEVDSLEHAKIVCNQIGINNDGSVAPNGFGIEEIFTEFTVIGGLTPADRNVVSGHTGGWLPSGSDCCVYGYAISAARSSQILGNYIGVSNDGVTPIGNRLDGIRTFGTTEIGHPLAPNIIANNGSNGISTSSNADIKVTHNIITANGLNGIEVRQDNTNGSSEFRFNEIRDNGLLGIEIDGTGANSAIPAFPRNAPTLWEIEDGNKLHFSFHSPGIVSDIYTFDVYHSDSCDSSGYGEGEAYIESFILVTTSSYLERVQTLSTPVPAGTVVSVIATNPLGGSSEFSNCMSEVDTFTVNATYDASDSIANGICADSNGRCTLRAAIQEANANNSTDVVRINFDIALNVSTILISEGPLPTITRPVFIDGTTLDVVSCPTDETPDSTLLAVVFDGTTEQTFGMRLGDGSDGSTIQGLAFRKFFIAGLSVESEDNIIQCNLFGHSTNASWGNGTGIQVSGHRNTIGGNDTWRRNVIANNDGAGIQLLSSASQNSVRGNYIGLRADGTAAARNSRGVWLSGNSTDNSIGAIVVATLEDGLITVGSNRIAGNTTCGVCMLSSGVNKVGGNIIGLTADGTAIGNFGGEGIQVSADNSIIGKTDGFLGGTYVVPNVIGGHPTGILVTGNNVEIVGNHIGTDPDLSAAYSNDTGIRLQGENATVQGNAIGTNLARGILVKGANSQLISNTISFNGSHGIQFAEGSNGSSATGNTINNNVGDGIAVALESLGVTIDRITLRQNRIFYNDHLGIDLGNNGITPNDDNDADGGQNEQINFPVLISAENNGLLTGSIEKERFALLTIDVFHSPNCDNQTNGGQPYGEGQTYAGTFIFAAEGNSFSFSEVVAPLPVGSFVTLVATDQAGNSSEFSNCVEVTEHVFVVTNKGNFADETPGDGRCATSGGFCTLPAAITEVNALSGGPFRIHFDLSGISGIILNQPLVVNTPVIIDGTTNGGVSCPTQHDPAVINIIISGQILNSDTTLLTLGAGSDGSEVRGLGFVSSKADGIRISGFSSNNVIACNWFGFNSDGSDGGNADDGVHISSGSNNRVGSIGDYADRNVFGYNTGAGIQLTGVAVDTIIGGNFIGTDLTGNAPAPNGYGIDVAGGVTHTSIGGSSSEETVVVAANTLDGIRLLNTTSVTVTGHYVGYYWWGWSVDDGGNGRYGIQVNNSSDINIGNTGNVVAHIRDNGTAGIHVVDSADVRIFKNAIFENAGSGVRVYSSNDVTIGGDSAELANSIYDNAGNGIYMFDNVIGTQIMHNAIGRADKGNSSNGIHLNDFVYDTHVLSNTITHNAQRGIRVDNDATGNEFLSNDIHDNGNIGIDLNENGPTDNDDDDTDDDSGGNGLQNYPVLSSASGGSGPVVGELFSNPSRSYLIQVFSNDACNGEGGTYIGQFEVTTDSSGYAKFSETLDGAVISSGDSILTTATDLAVDGTSEFSGCVTVSGTPTAVSLSEQQSGGSAAMPIVVRGLLGLLALTVWVGFRPKRSISAN